MVFLSISALLITNLTCTSVFFNIYCHKVWGILTRMSDFLNSFCTSTLSLARVFSNIRINTIEKILDVDWQPIVQFHFPDKQVTIREATSFHMLNCQETSRWQVKSSHSSSYVLSSSMALHVVPCEGSKPHLNTHEGFGKWHCKLFI